eukprot:366090-Chlamydomonas_euryale.AAC.3
MRSNALHVQPDDATPVAVCAQPDHATPAGWPPARYMPPVRRSHASRASVTCQQSVGHVPAERRSHASRVSNIARRSRAAAAAGSYPMTRDLKVVVLDRMVRRAAQAHSSIL